MSRAFSIYIHIPYCMRICPYCDFNVHASKNPPEKEYVSALKEEFLRKIALEDWRGRSVQSIYFGGGTPSLISSNYFGEFLEVVSKNTPIEEFAEITVEANPENLSRAYSESLLKNGINRLSVGAQSFNDTLLKTLGRQHTGELARASINTAREVGFRNISLDLMFSLPEQSVEMFNEDLEIALSLEPQHISAYELTIEQGTPYHKSFTNRELIAPEEDETLYMMRDLEGKLSKAGIYRYEISNFSKPNYHSRHNWNYWACGDYMGLGAGAHEHSKKEGHKIFGIRSSNFAIPRRYIDAASGGLDTASWREEIERDEARFEFLLAGLRRLGGIHRGAYELRFASSLLKDYEVELDVLQEAGLLVLDGAFVRLSSKGLLIFDSVLEYFAPSGVHSEKAYFKKSQMLEAEKPA